MITQRQKTITITSYFEYRCGHCNVKLDIVNDIIQHCSEHPESSIKYRYVEEEQEEDAI
jgi:protein-disulfide isomerase